MWDAGKDSERLAFRKLTDTHNLLKNKAFKSRIRNKMYFDLCKIKFNLNRPVLIMLSLLINSPGCACEFCCHSQIISECIHDGRYSPSVPSSLAASPQMPPGGCKNNSSQYTRRTPQHHQKPSSAFLPRHCCVVFRGSVPSQRPRLMNSRQLVGLKFIDRTATSPSAFLPGRAALIVQSVRSICY